MKYHEYANLFPMMPEPDLMRLAEDIKENGLSDSIITYNGEILDGRNRHKACEINNITPTFKEYDGDDPLGFVVSHNLHRRHLTESQRAMVAAKWAKLKHGGDRKSDDIKSPIGDLNQSETKTRDEAAKLLNVGTSSIDRAKKVIKEAPELVDKIEAGEMSVNAAYVTTKRPAITEEPDAKRIRKSKVSVIPRTPPAEIPEESTVPEAGVALTYARTALNALNQIPKRDPSRKQAIALISEWVENNKTK
jgi:ParB-like chromosome segregation protein Spo0J